MTASDQQGGETRMSEKQVSRYTDRFTELDEYFIHQTAHTMNEMGAGESDWLEHVELTVRPMAPVGAAPFFLRSGRLYRTST